MTEIIAKDAKLAKFTKILRCFFAIIVSFENFAVDPWPRGTL